MPEFLTAIGEFVNGSLLQSAALWPLRNVPGFPPIIQTVHILGIAVVMGSVVLLNLRILGLAVPGQPLPEMTGRVLPWLWWALAANFFSGAFFLFGRPDRYFNNPVFGWKLTFLVPAIVLAWYFHRMHRSRPGYWELNRTRRHLARGIAVVSLGLWLLVALAGRWIAYSEYLYYPA